MDPNIRKLRKLLASAQGFSCNLQEEAVSAITPECFARHDGKKMYIVSQAETRVELGHPSVPSASLLLWSEHEPDINNNRVTALGNDIGQLAKGPYSFAHVLLVGGPHLMPEHLSTARTLLGTVGALDGCMVRLTDEKIWVRLGSEIMKKGFSFIVWGHCLFEIIRKEVPSAERLEAVFVAGLDSLVAEINQLARAINENRRQKLLERLKQEGKDYECDNPYDCEECADKPECDTLKEVAGVVKRKSPFTKGGNPRNHSTMLSPLLGKGSRGHFPENLFPPLINPPIIPL